jgi:peptide chain release factor 2
LAHAPKHVEDVEVTLELAVESKDEEQAAELPPKHKVRETRLQISAEMCLPTRPTPPTRFWKFTPRGRHEASDWADNMLRMYLRWPAARYRNRVDRPSSPARTGIKRYGGIHGKNAFGMLRRENGIHRLVRISPSTAAKLPQPASPASSSIPTSKTHRDHRSTKMTSPRGLLPPSGAGGQHVNRPAARSASRTPDGIVVQCQNERSQHRNKDTASSALPRVVPTEVQEKEPSGSVNAHKKDIAWGSQIRSYVAADRLVKDLAPVWKRAT